MDPLIIILLCLTASYLLSEFFEGLRLPRVLGSLFVGLLLGLPVVNEFIFDAYSLKLIEAFADLGLIFIMFFVGLGLEVSELRKSDKNSIYNAIFTALVPFVIGYFAVLLLCHTSVISCENPAIIGLIVGGILCVTGEMASIDLLTHANALKTRLAKKILVADVFDNFVEALLISFLVTFIHFLQNPVYGILIIVFDLIIFFLMVYTAGFVVLPFVLRFIKRKQPKLDLFVVSLILSLFLAVASEYLGIGSILGALIAGMLMRYGLVKSSVSKRMQHEITDVMEITTFGFVAPFFFVWVGMQGNFSFLITNPWLAVVLGIAAFVAKPLGSVVGELLSKGRVVEGLTVGWGMNTRGAVELIAAELAWQNGLISGELFSALIFIAFITTIISPMFFSFYFKKYYSKKRRA
ncbi:cation:proton antiporter [Candidatus Woesearchaeota archaeon]|nr:cation:proton antiporter [Candidatus Woesearchaeota archaeon]